MAFQPASPPPNNNSWLCRSMPTPGSVRVRYREGTPDTTSRFERSNSPRSSDRSLRYSQDRSRQPRLSEQPAPGYYRSPEAGSGWEAAHHPPVQPSPLAPERSDLGYRQAALAATRREHGSQQDLSPASSSQNHAITPLQMLSVSSSHFHSATVHTSSPNTWRNGMMSKRSGVSPSQSVTGRRSHWPSP